jgi:hypothetical protein
MHVFIQYFGIPSGAVWSNILAEPIILILGGLGALAFRKPLGKQMAKWRINHHQHIKDHITSEIDKLRQELRDQA